MPKDSRSWHWFWCTVVSGWEPDVKQKVTELFGEHCRAKAAAGQCRWRVEQHECDADAAEFAAKLRTLSEVGVEYSFLRIADCSLARQRQDPRHAAPAAPAAAAEAAEAVEAAPGEDDDDDASDEGDDVESEAPSEEAEAESSSWRLARIRETSREVPAAVLLTAVRLWRAHEQQLAGTAAEAEDGPVRFRVTAKRGGKGHDFGSDDVKREAALGLIGSDAALACQLQPALRDYQVSVRAQVHRKSFVLGFPLHTTPFHAHQGRRFGGKEPPSPAATDDAAGSAPAPAPGPPRQRKEKKLKSSAEADLSEWLPCRLAELGLSASYPRDARDSVTPLHEMAYSEQVDRKQHEMTQVLKRMARKVRQAWQTQEKSLTRQRAKRTAQAEAAAAAGVAPGGAEPEPETVVEPEPEAVELPLWLEPRDGDMFLEMQPLRHCGTEANANWRSGYRNKVELAVGKTAGSVVGEGGDEAVVDPSRIAVGFQVQHGDAPQRKARKKKSNDLPVCAATTVIPLAIECLPSAVSPAMFALASAFEAFIAKESELPIFEPRVGGNKMRAEGVGFWIGLTLRCSRSGEQMVMVRVNGRHLIDHADTGCCETWLAEAFRLNAALSSASTSVDEPLPDFMEAGYSKPQIGVVRYDGEVPPMATKSLETLTSSEITMTAPAIEEELLGLKFRISPEAFFQVHTEAAERLASALCECTRRPGFSAPFAKASDEMSRTRASPQAVPLLLDVCCGAGTLGLVLARHCGCEKVWGVESCAPAVEDARVNASLNSLEDTAQFECGNAESKIDELLSQLTAGVGGVVAIVDPPRTGLKPSVCAALRKQPAIERVLFVSCNPHGHQMRFDYTVKGGSLIDNAIVLCGPETDVDSGAPFRPAYAQAVDLFPDTPHCELVVAFVRESVDDFH